MKFLPYENIILTSRLTEAEIKKRLSNLIEPGLYKLPILRLLKPTKKLYTGYFAGNTFYMRRLISGYPKPYGPAISGVIKGENIGTIVYIKIHPDIGALVGFGIFSAIMGLLSVVLLFTNLLSSLIPIAAFFIIYAFAMGNFRAEVSQLTKYLQKLFEAELTRL